MEVQSASVWQEGVGKANITHCGAQLSLHNTVQSQPAAGEPQSDPTVAAVHPGGRVVVVVLSKQDAGVHAQPDVQHAVEPLPAEKQAPAPAQSASDEHGNGN